MTDSFFTTKNGFDEQIETLGSLNTRMLAEASARRMVKLQGPVKAAENFYRIADICAGAYVMPLEQWQKQQASLNPPVPQNPVDRRDLPPVHRNPWFWSTMLLMALHYGLPIISQTLRG